MKKATIAAALSLVAFSVAAGTPSHGPAALRDLAVAPKMDITFSCSFRCRDGQQVIVQNKDPSDELRRLQTALQEQPGDIRRSVELAEWLASNGSTNETRAAWQNVEKLCRQHLEVNPDDSALLRQLGEALEGLVRNEEAESLYRRAVAVSSNDWRCWAGLGSFLQDRAVTLLASEKSTGRIQPLPNAAPDDWLNSRPTPDALQQSETRRHEAGRCLDRVLALAPKEPDAWVQLAAYAARSNWLSRLDAHFKNEDRPPLDSAGWARAFLCPDCVADVKHAAELDRTNYVLAGAASMFTVLALKDRSPDASRESLRASVQKEVLLLENLGRQPDKKAAAGALATLGFLQVMLDDKPGALERSREALGDAPGLDLAWDLQLALSVDSVSSDELVALCESRLKSENSVRNRLFLAKALLRQKKPERAEEQAQAVLKIEPDNLIAYTILMAADLERSENPQFMEAAQRDIGRAKEIFQALPARGDTADRWRELTLNLAIWCGLQDDPATRQAATARAQEVLQRIPDDQTAKDILQALQ